MRVRERIASYRDRIRHHLVAAFREERTPRQVAGSFALGIFITALPTGGLGIGLFFVFISLWPWISKPAIFASVAVLNPFVKPAVYIASFQTGAFLLRAESVRSRDATTTESFWVVIEQLLLGNLIIAVALAALGYVTVFHLTRAHRRKFGHCSETSVVSSVFGLFRR